MMPRSAPRLRGKTAPLLLVCAAAIAVLGAVAPSGVGRGLALRTAATGPASGTGGSASSAVEVVRVASWAPGMNAGGRAFADQTIREVVHVTAGGTAPRVRLSNLHGTSSLTVGHVDVAVQRSGGQAVRGTHHRVTFGGADSVTLAAGAERVSDPVSLTVANDQRLLVSIYVSGSTRASTWHPAAHDTTFVSTAGDHAADDGTGNYPTTSTSWYLLSRLDVASSTATGTLVAFGDSITDGTGSALGADHRYPDYLARRLAATAGGPRLSVVDAGIGGNRVLTDRGTTFGDSALHRFSHDAIGAGAVRDVILLEGINDITTTTVTAPELESGYRNLIAAAHARSAKIFGATILPWGGASSHTAARESVRQSVNAWIRTSGAFDGVFDLDAAMRDPNAPTRLLARYDSGDHLHPSDAGYAAMANAVNLAVLAP